MLSGTPQVGELGIDELALVVMLLTADCHDVRGEGARQQSREYHALGLAIMFPPRFEAQHHLGSRSTASKAGNLILIQAVNVNLVYGEQLVPNFDLSD